MAIDQFHIPNDRISRVREFYALAGNANDWQAYTVPSGAQFIEIICIGGGGGGGGGATGAAGTARGGGGGGGAGGYFRGIFSIYQLGYAHVLYVQVAKGGTGSAAGVAGGNGGASVVCLLPNSITSNIIAISSGSGNNGLGGGAGTSATGGSGGSGAGALTLTNYPLTAWGVSVEQNGNGGTAGGAQTGANGANQNIMGTSPLMGGTGGGGTPTGNTNFTGGNLLGVAGSFQALQQNGGAAGGGRGLDGTFYRFPLMSTGGTGGGTNGASGTGGAGGKGAFGSGGGGGGGGVTGGAGGNGGDGIIIIKSW